MGTGIRVKKPIDSCLKKSSNSEINKVTQTINATKISEPHLLTCNKNLKQNCDFATAGTSSASLLTTYNVKPKSPTFSVNCDQCGHVKCAKTQVDSDGSSTASSASSFNYQASSKINDTVTKCVCGDRGNSAKYSLGQRNIVQSSRTSAKTMSGNRTLLRSLCGRDARSATSLDGSSSNVTTNSSNDQHYYFDQVEMKRIRDRIAQADVFLEAIGNATTIKNYNSSRYVSIT